MKTRILSLVMSILFVFTINAQRKLSRDKIQINKTKNAKVLGTDARGNVFDNSNALDTLASKEELQSFPYWNINGTNFSYGATSDRNIEVIGRRGAGESIVINYPSFISNSRGSRFNGSIDVIGGVNYQTDNESGSATIKKHPETTAVLTYYLPKGSMLKPVDTLATVSDIIKYTSGSNQSFDRWSRVSDIAGEYLLYGMQSNYSSIIDNQQTMIYAGNNKITLSNNGLFEVDFDVFRLKAQTSNPSMSGGGALYYNLTEQKLKLSKTAGNWENLLTTSDLNSSKDDYKLNIKSLPTLSSSDRVIALDSSDNKLKFWDGTSWHALY